MLRTRSVYIGREVGLREGLLNSFIVFGGDSKPKEKLWFRKTLLLFPYLMKKEKGSKKLTYRSYVECVSRLDKVQELLRSVCLQRVSGGSM